MGWLSGWDYRKKITVQYANIDSDLTWFPLYVDITADTDIGGHVSDTTNGYDIRFTKTDGTTLLAYEREYFNVTDTTATGHYWVSGDGWVLANDAGTEFYIYYNDGDGTVDGEDAANVWDANFVSVWHMSDATISTISDSKGSNDGTKEDDNEPIETTTAKIYKAQDFDGVDDYITCGTDVSLDVVLGTLSFGMYLDALPGATDTGIICKDNSGANIGDFNVNMGYTGEDDKLYWFIDDPPATGKVNSDGALSATTWYHVALLFGTGGMIMYINGIAQADTDVVTEGMTNASANLMFGVIRAGLWEFDGKLDEIRLSDSRRAIDWSNFEYHNMHEDDNELDWGAETTETPITYIPQVIMII